MKIGCKQYALFLEQLLDRLRNSLGDEVILSLALFGSVARNEARPDSDIDLLIVHRKVGFYLTRRFVRIVFELKEEKEYQTLKKAGLNPNPCPVFMTEDELWERPLMLLDILDHGRILFDTGILQKRLQALKKRLAELGSKKVVLDDGRWYWDLKPDWKPGEVIEL